MRILIILLSILSFSFAHAKEASFDEKTALLQELIQSFESMCLDSKGEILEKTIVVDRSSVLNDGEVISCADEAKRLAKMIQELQADLNLQAEEKKKEEAKQCAVVDAHSPLSSQSLSLASSTSKFASKMEEGPQCKEQTGKECVGDIACNFVRGVLARPALALTVLPDKFKPKMPKCLDSAQSDCVTEFLAGVLKDIWSNLEGLWDLGKMALKGAKNAAVSAWDWAFGVEDKTSDAALLASKQSESSLQLFLKDPLGFLKKIGSDIWDMLTKSIYDNYGCEKWSGVPHVSKCLKSMSSWGCSSCNQKINAVCGVAGVLGGEVLIAWFTGGTVSVAGKAGTKGAQAITKINQLLIKAVPKIAEVEKGLVVAAKVAAIPFTKGMQLASKLVKSETSLKILNFAKKAKAPLSNAALKLSKTKPLAITVKVVKGVTSPVTSYMKLLDKSFEAGMRAGSKLGSKTATGGMKFSEAMRMNEKIQDTEELIVNTHQLDGISPEVMKSRLKENNIPYEEVHLPDGTVAERIKVDPACSLSGKSSILLK